MERKVIVIVGPTCTGKSKVAFELARKINSEIISADSRQIYKQLNIGTAKPTELELRSVKHYFINQLNIDESFDASKFEIDGLKIIKKIINENKIPIVVGGSGLYIKALIDGIISTVPNDNQYRKELLNLKMQFGNDYLYNELKKVDPLYANKLLPQNWKRVIRALEVFKISGKSILEIQKESNRINEYEFLQFGIRWERKKLYERINDRVDDMIESGLIEEVKNILSQNYNDNLYSLNTVGYKEIIEFLNNKHDLKTAVELIKRNTRRYAKKQFTWFNKDKRIYWFDVERENQLVEIPNMILDFIKKNNSKNNLN